MSPPSTKQQDTETTLGEAVEALLSEVGETCDRFENPPEPEEDSNLCADGGATAPRPSPKPIEPDPDPVAETESALEAVETTAADLLEQAADDLVEQLTEIDGPAQAAAAEPDDPENPPEPEPEPEAASEPEPGPAAPPAGEAEALLADAADELMGLDFGGPPAQGSAPPAVVAPEPVAEPEPEESTPTVEDETPDALNADTLDAVLDGTFETPEGDVDTDAVAQDTGGFTLPAEPEGVVAGPVPTPDPEPEIEPEPQTSEARSAVEATVPEPRPIPEPAPQPVAAVPVVAPLPAGPVPAWRRLIVWAEPRARRAAGVAGEKLGPAGAQALILLSRPLAKQPAKVRDSVGWVALWTAFLALCVLGWVVVRPAEQRAPDPTATGIVSADTPPPPGE